MKRRLQRMGAALAACAFAASLLGLPPGSARSDAQGHSAVTLRLQERSVAVARTAHARYRLLKQVERRLRGFGFGITMDAYNAVLYPIARSDRAYVVMLPVYSRKSHSGYVDCYERHGNRVERVYRIRLERRVRHVSNAGPAKAAARFATLLDYVRYLCKPAYYGYSRDITEESFAVKGRLSKGAQSDLAARRQYVLYEYRPFQNSLQVSLLSEQGGPSTSYAAYDIAEDPLTGAALRGDAFYRKYGLPAAKQELPLLQRGHKPMGPVRPPTGDRRAGRRDPPLRPVTKRR